MDFPIPIIQFPRSSPSPHGLGVIHSSCSVHGNGKGSHYFQIRGRSDFFLSNTIIYHIYAFYTPVSRRPYYVIGYGGRPHRFPHNNFSSVYRIFTKLGHMIPLWKGKNPINFGVIRSKFKVTVTINRNFDNRVVSAR